MLSRGKQMVKMVLVEEQTKVQSVPLPKSPALQSKNEGEDNLLVLNTTKRPNRVKKQEARELIKEVLNTPSDTVLNDPLFDWDGCESENYEPGTSSSSDEEIIVPRRDPKLARLTPSEKSNNLSHRVTENEKEHTTGTGNDTGKTKRKKGQDVKECEWARNYNAQKRQKGEKYLGLKKQDNGKFKLCNEREEKKIKPRCQCKGTQKDNCCEKITEPDRERLFNNFWKGVQGWEAKKATVVSLVEKSVPSFRRGSTESVSARKNVSFKYYLKKGDERVRVCKTMFLNTFSLGEKSVRNWVLKSPLDKQLQEAQNEILNNNDGLKGSVKRFLESLPKMESHYCRATSTLQYLEPIWESKRQLYREYQNSYCKINGEPISASWSLFYQVLKTSNIGFFLPKKDQCEVCIKHKLGKVNDVEYKRHQDRKAASRQEKQKDKERAIKNNEIAAYVVDVQKVLTCPDIKASTAYYKTKLKVHNWSVYNLATADASCYVWHEGNGSLDSNVFSSIITRFLFKEINENPELKEIIIWSDGCIYQNRCENVSNALLYFAIQTGVTVYQKYLEVGHTQMEVDSVHSVIERKLKKQEHYVPGDFIRAMREARIKPRPYFVESLQYKDFMNYSNGYYSSIRPGTKAGEACVTDLRSLQYLPDGHIRYKLNLSDDYMELPRRPKLTGVYNTIEPLYTQSLAIQERKFKDLQELKICLEQDYHTFYDSLRHGKCENTQNECPHVIR